MNLVEIRACAMPLVCGGSNEKTAFSSVFMVAKSSLREGMAETAEGADCSVVAELSVGDRCLLGHLRESERERVRKSKLALVAPHAHVLSTAIYRCGA